MNYKKYINELENEFKEVLILNDNNLIKNSTEIVIKSIILDKIKNSSEIKKFISNNVTLDDIFYNIQNSEYSIYDFIESKINNYL